MITDEESSGFIFRFLLSIRDVIFDQGLGFQEGVTCAETAPDPRPDRSPFPDRVQRRLQLCPSGTSFVSISVSSVCQDTDVRMKRRRDTVPEDRPEDAHEFPCLPLGPPLPHVMHEGHRIGRCSEMAPTPLCDPDLHTIVDVELDHLSPPIHASGNSHC